MIFDYNDYIYKYGNPLNYVIFKELNDTLRKSFNILSKEEQYFIKEIILEEKSITHVALILQLSPKEVHEKLEESLEILYRLFQNSYL